MCHVNALYTIYIEWESIQQEINFLFVKALNFNFKCLYQLHIYNKLLLQLPNLQTVFYNFLFFVFGKWEY